MNKTNIEEQRFLNDVAKHEMIIIRDDGVNRHIRFKRSGTSCMHFDLITWPGYLCYTGDMGTYVFCRLEDMFEFFRADRKHARPEDGKALAINPDYWGEKLQAVDTHGGFRQYNADIFHRIIKEIVDSHITEEELSGAAAKKLRDAVADEVFTHDETEQDAHEAARDFDHEGFQFHDFWEHDLKEFSHRFMWCCYALAWGIQKYDEHKQVGAA